jgi:alpha-beta hydrolase superfamily lysophospholipase
MPTNHFQLKTSDNLTLKGVSWMPEQPKAIALLVHGFGEHIQRYEHVAALFNKKNIGLVAYDRRGHGTSEGQRGHFPNIETEFEDLGIALEYTKTAAGSNPVFLYGHSQGGNFALNYALRKKPTLSGCIITSPWIQLTTEPPKALVAIGKVVHKFLPTVSTKAAVNPLSRDPEVDKKYYADELVHGTITFRAANETMSAGDWLSDFEGKIELPTLLMHGSGDKVTSCEASQAFANQVSGSLDTKWWDGFYHELHNEPEQVEVIEYMTNWVEKQLG